jgi:hypothetical protein
MAALTGGIAKGLQAIERPVVGLVRHPSLGSKAPATVPVVMDEAVPVSRTRLLFSERPGTYSEALDDAAFGAVNSRASYFPSSADPYTSPVVMGVAKLDDGTFGVAPLRYAEDVDSLIWRNAVLHRKGDLVRSIDYPNGGAHADEAFTATPRADQGIVATEDSPLLAAVGGESFYALGKQAESPHFLPIKEYPHRGGAGFFDEPQY